MKRHEALPSKYLTKEDFPKPVLCQIKDLRMEEIKTERGTDTLPVLYVKDPDAYLDIKKGIIIARTSEHREEVYVTWLEVEGADTPLLIVAIGHGLTAFKVLGEKLR